MCDNTSFTLLTKRESEADSSGGISGHGTVPEPCAACGQTNALEWLQAPDRLHGRQVPYKLLRCPKCSLVWLHDPPKPEEMHLHYTEAYHKLISGAGGADPTRRWKDRRATLGKYKRSVTLLDLGCSSGSFLECMRSESWNLYGVEMSAEEASAAESRTGARVFVGVVPDAPFAPETFDVITCFDVLEHLYEPQRVLAKVGEWLKPGGIFYVQVPNIDSAEERVFGKYWHGLELPRHLFHYSPKSLKLLTESVGLREVLLETQRNPAVGTSLRYVWDDIFQGIGIQRTPVAYSGEASLPWRAARKLVRMSVLKLLLALAPLVGDGEAIHAIFLKEQVNSGAGIG